jgi:hypothetical protein
MNELPQVLRNEIWEYVRGDRAYWRKVFREGLFAHWRFGPRKPIPATIELDVPWVTPEMADMFRMAVIESKNDYWKRVIGEVNARLDRKFQTFLRRHYSRQTRNPKPKTPRK